MCRGRAYAPGSARVASVPGHCARARLGGRCGGEPGLHPGGVGVSYLRTACQEAWKWVVAIDQAILLGVRRWESAMMTRLMRMLTRMGDPAAWAVVGLTLGVVAGARYTW